MATRNDGDLRLEISRANTSTPAASMYADRKAFYQRIESDRNSKVLAYVTGDRPGLETQIHHDVLDPIADHLDTFGLPDKISLVLYSRGGSTLAGWSIANLIRQFCKRFEVIVPAKAHSTATLIALAAEMIVMTKQATLGPIDPSTNSALNPPVPGGAPNARLPVSVEEVIGYLELAKKQAELRSKNALAPAFLKLADQVHPIALGNVYRTRAQIQMLAKRLLSNHMKNQKDVERVVSFICSESGSHDYAIFRREAKETLKLPIEKPTQEMYDSVIKPLYVDVRQELQLNERFDFGILLGANNQANYSFKRGLIESITGGQHVFVSEGTITKKTAPTPSGIVTTGFEDQKSYEGWKFNAP
jgi:hypothetical protein